MLKVFRAALVALAATAVVALPAAASASTSNPSIGTYRVVDHGQGCWAGGSMFADGSLGGGGGCSVLVKGLGHAILKIDPLYWVPLGGGTYLVCANFILKSGPASIIPPGLNCAPLQATSGAPLPVPLLGPGTFGKIVLTGNS